MLYYKKPAFPHALYIYNYSCRYFKSKVVALSYFVLTHLTLHYNNFTHHFLLYLFRASFKGAISNRSVCVHMIHLNTVAIKICVHCIDLCPGRKCHWIFKCFFPPSAALPPTVG